MGLLAKLQFHQLFPLQRVLAGFLQQPTTLPTTYASIQISMQLSKLGTETPTSSEATATGNLLRTAWPPGTHAKLLRTGRDCLVTWTLGSLGQRLKQLISSKAISIGSSKTWHRVVATRGPSPKDSLAFRPALTLHLFGAAMARSTSSKVATTGSLTLKESLM